MPNEHDFCQLFSEDDSSQILYECVDSDVWAKKVGSVAHAGETRSIDCVTIGRSRSATRLQHQPPCHVFMGRFKSG